MDYLGESDRTILKLDHQPTLSKAAGMKAAARAIGCNRRDAASSEVP